MKIDELRKDDFIIEWLDALEANEASDKTKRNYLLGMQGSSLFLMDKMLFQFTRIGFCDDIHTKQRRAVCSHTQTVCKRHQQN
jgi:hypothetical protein